MSSSYISSNWRLLNQENSNKSDNYGLSFDGSNEVIQADDFQLTNSIDTCSYSAWVNIDSSATGVRGIFGKGKSGANFEFNVRYYTAGTNLFIIQINGTTVFQNSSLSLATDAWHHIVVVIDRNLSAGSNIKLFVNNAEITNESSVTFAQFTSTGYPLYIGAEADTGTSTRFKWLGKISEAAVFDYALSSTQISTLYGSSSLGAGNPMALKPQPVAYYPLGDNSASNPLTQPNEAVEDASVFDFNGSSSQFINNGYFNKLDSSDLSFSIWLKKTNTDYAQVVDSQTAGNSGILIAINSSDQVFVRVNTLTASTTTSGFANIGFQRDKWQNIILTYNNTTRNLIVYLNNQSVSNTTGSLTTKGASLELKIGGVSGSYFTGQISNAQIWNTELSSSEVTTLYNSGVPLLTGTQPQEANLKAWYKLDQSANWEADSSGNWQIPDAVSAYPQSFDFDSASNNYIDCGNNSSLQIFQNSHTQSFWIKYTGTVQGYIGGYGVDSVVIFHGSDRIRFYTKGLTSGTDFYSTSTLSDNEWYHIACTYELNGDKKIYINGVLDNTVSTSGTITSEGVAYTIGARNLNSSIDNYFEGNISNVQLFNTALPATGSNSIETLYNNGVPLTTAIASDNLKAWYKLNNTATFSTNWSIPDASGNGNTGTSSGMTEQNLVNNNVSVLNGESSGMTSANLVLSDLSRSLPYDSYSFSFDGVNDYIQTTSNSLFNGLTAFSISCWIKRNGTQQSYAAVLSYQTSTSQYLKLNFNTYTDKIEMAIRPGTTSVVKVTSSAGSIPDGEWVHIAVVGDANNLSNLNMYINGVLDNDITSGNITTLAQSSDIHIGTDAGNPSAREFNGKISNISVFNEALTSTEVLKLYSNGVPQDLANFTPAPVAWYPLGSNSFWNGSQWTVRDMIGSNDGTGQNIGIDGLVGDAPRSEANGTGTNMDVPTNLEGSTKWSSNNSWSINMSSTARVEDTP